MFKLLHFSDSHLGYWQYQFSDRLLDFGKVLDEVVRVAIEQKVDLVVDTGDTFHSPEPDPLSVAMHRRFVEKLQAAGIPHLAVIGNHNLHDVGRTFVGQPSWLEAVSDKIVRPRSPGEPWNITNRSGDHTITVVAADWMPSEAIDGFVARIPGLVDCLFMHQSCQGFMPVIARAELDPAQVDGKARYVGVGDIHLCKRALTPKGTVIGSPGSTEFCRSDEPHDKYAVLVSIPQNHDQEILWQPCPLRTRKAYVFPTVASEDQLKAVRQTLLNGLTSSAIMDELPPHYGYDNPLVVMPYHESLERSVTAVKRELREKGFTMLKFSRESSVEEDRDFVTTKSQSSTAMVEIVAELLVREPELVSVATDLWNNPDNFRAVIDQIKDRIRTEVMAPPVPAPAPGAVAA